MRAEDAPEAGDIQFEVHTLGGQTEFHIGELITLELSYSLRPGASGKYQITNASYDRSGRLGIENYKVEPHARWDDPLKSYFESFVAFMGGGLSSPGQLSIQPVRIYRNLNEQVRFNSPGHYSLVVLSSRVAPVGRDLQDPPLEIRSNQLSLTIVPATPEWQKETLETALEKLAKQPRGPVLGNTLEAARNGATILRYLGTPGAAKEMASRLNDPDTQFEFRLGLASTPAREAALATFEQLLHDPSFPVNNAFLSTMPLVALPTDVTVNRPQRREQLENKFEQELLTALPTKRGNALAVSAYTIVERAAMYSSPLPSDQKRRLTEALVAGFDKLPLASQVDLLQYRSQALDKNALLPILPKIAQMFQDSPQAGDAYQANQLSAAALTRWWQADPDNARAAILKEILRPKPRFDTGVLGVLPEKELPEVEQSLADHLTTTNGSEEQIASLISRYATASIESQVSDYLDPQIGKLACAIQTPLLAYLLRVDPTAAVPRLQKAMAARGSGFSGCNHSLLVEVAALHNDPSLQDIAIKSLDDGDTQVVGNAATYLGGYGSAQAEEPLWNRLTSWSVTWKGRGAEFKYVPGESMDSLYEQETGNNLIAALGSGQGWLTDEAELNRLVDLSVGPNQRDQTQQLLKAWQAQPREIQFINE